MELSRLFMHVSNNFYPNFLMPCFNLYVFLEICKLASLPLHLGQYSCASLPQQSSVLNMDYIILFAMLFPVDVATFVAAL